MGNFITYSDLQSDAPSFIQTRGILDLLFLRRNNNSTPLDWANLLSSAYPHTTNSLVDIGNCIGAIAQYLYQDIGLPTPDIEQLISRGAYKSAFSFPDPAMEALYASTGSTFDMTWWNGNHGQNPVDYSLANIEIAFGLTTSSLQNAAAGQAFVPTGGQPSPPPSGNRGGAGVAHSLEDSKETNFAGMSGLTSYNIVQGDFITSRFPQPDSQTVKQTIQGVVDEFEVAVEDMSLKSVLQENDAVTLTETVYQGEINNLQNFSWVSVSQPLLADSRTWFNRLICNGGGGSIDSLGNILSSSVFDELVAIAVDDIRPFLIKNLDYIHDADIVNDEPTNDAYINHLTPSDEPYIAKLILPRRIRELVGGLSTIHIYYDAIDLTGETVAGVGMTQGTFSQHPWMSLYHDNSKAGYLVVKKTIPCLSQVYDVGGSLAPLGRIITKPDTYGVTITDISSIQLKIVSPGGIVELPTKDFKRPIKSNVLKSKTFGGSFPSPYIDVSDCLIKIKDNPVKGIGKPKRVKNTLLVDTTPNSNNNMLIIESPTGEDNESFTIDANTPRTHYKTFDSRATLQIFDIIDNEINQNHHEVLVMPKNKTRTAMLDDLRTSDGDNLCTVELNLLDGRVEQLNLNMEDGEGELSIRGRSKLMDVADTEVQRNLNIGEANPIKEIGDLGTPTVSLTLGGVGQGGADTRPQFEEHSYLQGWKDKIVSSSNPSVRNDKQTSTYYASTRALVELPLFPSMFFDVDNVFSEISNTFLNKVGVTDNKEIDGRHPEGFDFNLTIDCTMTARNRPQMQHYEARNAIDWGYTALPAIEISKNFIDEVIDDLSPTHSYGLRIGKSKIQAVVTGHDLTLGPSAFGIAQSYIQVDDIEAFTNEANTNLAQAPFHVIVGEGVVAPTTNPELAHCTYLHFRVVKMDDALNRLYIDKAFLRYPRNDVALDIGTGSGNPSATSFMFTGATVQMGGVIVNDTSSINHTESLKFQMTKQGQSGDVLINIRNNLAAEIDNALGFPIGRTIMRQRDDNTNLRKDWNFIYIIDTDVDILQWDVFQERSSDNDRDLREPIVCYPDYLGLKGHHGRWPTGDFAGEMYDLNYVVPFKYSLRDIASGKNSFDECVDELIRKINMGGIPEALFANGNSAFKTFLEDPSNLIVSATDVNTSDGSHLGYVRAFRGASVESVTGEKGFSIVIHSTIPGATGRNFAVWLENNSIYPYRPQKAVGTGGLLATNSRSYQTNSFPAPLPIGSDGETFVPITTFTGAVHGSLTHHLDSTNALRKYDGLGQRLKLRTIDSTVHSTAYTFGGANNNIGTRITVASQGLELLRRNGRYNSGICKVGNAYGEWYALKPTYGTAATQTLPGGVGGPGNNTTVDGESYIQIRPFDTTSSAIKNNFISGANETLDVEIEIVWPLIDKEGILFFGGGHTGLVFDISDGSRNDYTNMYKHLYAGSANKPFAGFMNLGEMQQPTAVIDFTNVRNEDTINDNSLKGLHHKTILSDSGSPIGWSSFYARLTNWFPNYGENITPSTPTDITTKSTWVEDLYGVPLRISRSPTNIQTSTPGITSGIEGTGNTSAIFEWSFPCVVHTGLAVPASSAKCEHGELEALDPTTGSWAISAIVKNGSLPLSGPVFHGIYDDGTNVGKPYGLHLGGSAPVGNIQQLQIALSHYTSAGLLDASVLTPQNIPSLSPDSIKINTTGWTFVMMGRDNATNKTFCYIGNTVGITNPSDGVITAGIFDFSDHITVTADRHYGLVNPSPNALPTFQTKSSGYNGGTNDHPVPYLQGATTSGNASNYRDVGMHTIGGAMIGAPYVRLNGTSTQGGIANPNFTNYFANITSGVAPSYGIGSSSSNGLNSDGPISFLGYLSEVAVFSRKPSFSEAQEWFASYSTW